MEFTFQQKANKIALDQVYDTSPIGIAGHFLVVMIVGYLLIGVVPFYVILQGVSIHLLILAMRSYNSWRYSKIQKTIDKPYEINQWTRYYAIGVLLTGAAWGFSFLLFSYNIPSEYHFFLYAVLVSLAGSGIVTLGTVFSIYLSFMIPMLGIFSLWILFQEGKIYTVGFASLLILMAFYSFTARRYSMHFSKSIIEKERAIQTQYEIIQRLSNVSELKDYETNMHINRMSHYTYLLAKESGQDEAFTEDILHASSMHDIGKLAIPDHILLKTGKLNDEEWCMMKSHTEAGRMILENSESKLIQLSESIAFTHHEKYDGSGYPRGLKGKNIPIEGRITAIADVFDALVSERPYKKGWSNKEAFTFIQEQGGIHFDPELVKHFIKLAPKIIAYQKKHTDQEVNAG